MARRIIGIHEKLPLLVSFPLSIQHLTAMFGATVLVPILLGIDPAINNADWIALPKFHAPVFNLSAIIIIGIVLSLIFWLLDKMRIMNMDS